MAKKKKSKLPQNEMLKRIDDWVAVSQNCSNPEIHDHDLIAAGRSAWQLFVNSRPRQASMVLSTTMTIARLYDFGCAVTSGHSIISDVIDVGAVHEHLHMDDLIESTLRALLVDVAAVISDAAKNELYQSLLYCIHGRGNDYITAVLGLVPMVSEVFDRAAAGEQMKAADLAGLLAYVQERVEKHGKEID